MKTGVELIADERQEQIEQHGWDKSHDKNEHTDGSLCRAACAICYDGQENESAVIHAPDWAWDIREHKQRLYKGHESADKISRLIIAGALIAAEIDRLQGI